MQIRSRLIFLASGSAVLCAASASARPAPEFVGPPPAPFTQMAAYACGDGQCSTVLGVMEKFSPTVSNAFQWSAALGFTNLSTAASLPNLQYAVPNVGGTAYVGTAVNLQRVYHWVPPAAPVDVGMLPGMIFASSAVISADGSKIAGVMSPTGNGANSRGFTWTAAGGLVDMNLPTATRWVRVAWLSADGSTVIGDAFTPGGVRSVFRWTASGGAVFLPPPTGFTTGLNVQASPDGQTIAGLGSKPGIPDTLSIWRDGAVSAYGLPAAPYDGLTINAVSGDGRTIVGQMTDTTNGNSSGYVWKRNTGFLPVKAYLSSLGWDVSQWNQMEAVVGISEDGRTIVGRGTRVGNPQMVAWRAQNAIPPACDGDFDGNGAVNTSDLTAFLAAFLAAFGKCPGAPAYRINLNIDEADPCITTADLVALLGAFGQACN